MYTKHASRASHCIAHRGRHDILTSGCTVWSELVQRCSTMLGVEVRRESEVRGRDGNGLVEEEADRKGMVERGGADGLEVEEEVWSR